MSSILDIFGSNVFNDTAMQEYLSIDVYTALKKTIKEGSPLDLRLANAIAKGMKDWALSKGATHYTHWFQPMTGITAEKHDSFLSRDKNGDAIIDFSGKELIKGEPDGSSFPSGGLRATFEARGYTTWDPTSYAFLKDNTLCIPTAFCSYGGLSLDKKTPLLRSMTALNKQALRIMKLFGTKTSRVISTVGSEQEYFLIDRKLFFKRKDLVFCNRTLFGAHPPKGQELDDHYFGAIKPRIASYMKELDEELWKLGIYAKTKHNETAPAQHELAPIYTETNIAADHNQLTMEIMKKIAVKHGLTCLLHEKPFEGVNGSGKHNNWSISTDSGINLLDPGDSPSENAQFLLILTAIIKAVDEHQDLLRLSVATAGNDHRLGGHEAPPAIISIFLGEELTTILESIRDEKPYNKKNAELLTLGVDTLPSFPKDSTDRNRTSPFAFSMNKFEFRSLGASVSISCPNIMLNTIIADAFCQFADVLEKAEDFTSSLNQLIRDNLKKHSRIIFNGNGYDDAWVREAKKRGLLNLKNTAEALPYFLDTKNRLLFTKHKVHTELEMESRYEVLMENYCKVLHIEALTMIDMAKKDIFPSVLKYLHEIANTVNALKTFLPQAKLKGQERIARTLALLFDQADEQLQSLEKEVGKTKDIEGVTKTATYYAEKIIPAMNALRESCDEMECLTSKEHWPFPSYADLLFRV